ncbi:hypothetical protein AAY473_021309 [Plecturocebus cupreus]
MFHKTLISHIKWCLALGEKRDTMTDRKQKKQSPLWEAKVGGSPEVSGVRDQPDQHGETPSLLKIQKLAGHSALWEAEADGSRGQEIETILANTEDNANTNYPNSKHELSLGKRKKRSSTVAHACNPRTLGGQGGQITRFKKLSGRVQWLTPVIPTLWEVEAGGSPEPGQHGEMLSLLKIQKLDRYGGAHL